MTGREALARALALMHETDTAAYEPCACAWLNTVRAELYDVARCRSDRTGSPITALASVSSLDEELPYDEELCARAVPFGLCARIYSEEGDSSMLSLYKQEYAAAASACDAAVVKLV